MDLIRVYMYFMPLFRKIVHILGRLNVWQFCVGSEIAKHIGIHPPGRFMILADGVCLTERLMG